MAYNFLGLVNDVNRRVNETALTSSNFSTAVGFYGTAKDAINNSIHQINQDTFQWPFNFVEQEDTLTAGDLRYDWPTGAKSIDWNTFRVKRDATFGNPTNSLKPMDYEQYLRNYVDDEYNTSNTGIRGVPNKVCQAPGYQYIVHPAPKEAYALVYEYYQAPIEMELFSDIPSIPQDFRHIIVDGAMYHVHVFRNNDQAAQVALSKFQEGINHMRTLYVNRYEYVRDSRVAQPSLGVISKRVN